MNTTTHTTLTPNAFIVSTPHSDRYTYAVFAVWEGAETDIRKSHRIEVPSMAMAKRLAKAINAGVVLTNPEVATATDGLTYIKSDCNVMGRRINADLNRLGF